MLWLGSPETDYFKQYIKKIKYRVYKISFFNKSIASVLYKYIWLKLKHKTMEHKRIKRFNENSELNISDDYLNKVYDQERHGSLRGENYIQ